MAISIVDGEFKKLVSKCGGPLLIMADYISRLDSVEKILSRPLLGELLAHSMQLEEILDAYGARNNKLWRPFRSLVATIKNFSEVSYELLHIQHVLPSYRLHESENEVKKATEQTMLFTGDVILRSCKFFLEKSKQLGLEMPDKRLDKKYYTEEFPPGQLAHDHARRKIETVSKTVTLLATSFLNLAAESRLVHAAGRARPEEYPAYLPDPVSEESLRALELRFHNLQSTYDTYVSGTETEDMDEDLPILRGHISIVLHLLKTAVDFSHFYERHIKRRRSNIELPVSADVLLAMLMDYSLAYASKYINSGQKLAQEMLKRYAEVGQVEVHAPCYRGFHVRPSTLISKLVQHYGSKVKMVIDDDEYDAGSALELFRANEKINAEKRRSLTAEIGNLSLCQDEHGEDFDSVLRKVIMTLAERKKIVIYEQHLQLPEEPSPNEITLLEKVTSAITKLLATGKIDVESDIKVKFIGDKRVLEDIRLLAVNGYGEDSTGNNIPLPEKLSYLRR